MPPIKKPTTCHEHDLAIQKLQDKMETLERHHNYFKERFGTIELMLEELKYFSINTNNAIDKFKDIPDRMRKQEDKAIVYDLIKVGCGIVLGLLITNYVGQVLASPREEKQYKIENRR